MSELQTKRITKIIFDEPASEDAFQSGGHTRCASALASSIEQISENPRDGAIGLEGQWGSGKSTVINLAEKKLAEQTDGKKNCYSTFTFDLWTHQTEDFRRAFLEAFVTWLEKQKLIDQKEAGHQRDAIRDRVKRIRLNNNRRYNVFAVIVLAFAPLVPLAYAWLSPFALNILQGRIPIPLAHWLASISLYAFILLYLVFALRFGWAVYKSSNPGFWGRIEDAGSQAVSMFSHDVKHETTTQNIRETDPTTVEFHRLFRALLSKVQSAKHRIVFVLDNVDRLPNAQIPIAWSEVRALFSNELAEGAFENADVTAVVPYDKACVLEAFNREQNGRGERQEDLIEKTFIRVLRVTPPIGTDWRQFMYSCLDQVFAEPLDEATKFRLFKLLHRYWQDKNESATPRKIIKFANELGALFSLWGDEISTDALALYSLFQSNIDEHIEALKNPELVPSQYLHIVDALNWQGDFAALTFNVPPDMANQVYLDGEIAKALTAADAEALKVLSKLDAFPEVLSDVLADRLGDWASEGGETLGVAAENLEQIELSAQARKLAWGAFGRALVELGDFDLDGFENSGVLAVIRNSEDPVPLAHTLANKISTAGKAPDDDQNAQFETGQLWLKAINAVKLALESSLSDDMAANFISQLRMPGKPHYRLGIARACADVDGIRFGEFKRSRFEPSLAPDPLNSYISASPADFRILVGELLNTALSTGSAAEQVLTPTLERLGAKDLAEEKDIRALLEASALLWQKASANKDAQANLSSAVSDGTLVFRGNEAEANGDELAAATCIWLVVTSSEQTGTPTIQNEHPRLGALAPAKSWYTSKIADAAINPTQIERICELIEATGDFSDWARYAFSDQSENSFFIEVLRRLVDRSKFISMTVVDVALKYQNFKTALGDVLAQKLLNHYAIWAHVYEKYFTKEKCLRIPNAFIDDVEKLEKTSKTREVLSLLDKHLKALSREEWETSFKSGSDALRLLVKRQQTAQLTIPIKAFQPALLNFAVEVLSGGDIPSGFKETLGSIVLALPSATRSKFPGEVFRKLPAASVSQDGAETFVAVFEEVANSIPLAENADVALDQFLSKLITSTAPTSMDFVRNRAKSIKALIKKANAEAVAGFQEALSGLDDADDEDTQKWAVEVRDLLGLEIKQVGEAEPQE